MRAERAGEQSGYKSRASRRAERVGEQSEQESRGLRDQTCMR